MGKGNEHVLTSGTCIYRLNNDPALKIKKNSRDKQITFIKIFDGQEHWSNMENIQYDRTGGGDVQNRAHSTHCAGKSSPEPGNLQKHAFSRKMQKHNEINLH